MSQCLWASFKLEEMKKQMLLKASESTGGNRTRAAALLGVSRARFNYLYRRAIGG